LNNINFHIHCTQKQYHLNLEVSLLSNRRNIYKQGITVTEYFYLEYLTNVKIWIEMHTYLTDSMFILFRITILRWNSITYAYNNLYNCNLLINIIFQTFRFTLFHAFQSLHFCLLTHRLMHSFHTCHVVLVSTWTAWTWIYYLRQKAIWLHDLLPVWLKMSPMLITRHHLVSGFCKKKIAIIVLKMPSQCVNKIIVAKQFLTHLSCR